MRKNKNVIAEVAQDTLAPATTVVAPVVAPVDMADVFGGNYGVQPAPAKPARVKFGVAPAAKTRAYYAGIVVAKHGHANGISDEMVGEVDAAYGEANAVESAICLRNAWHAIRGFYSAGGVAPTHS